MGKKRSLTESSASASSKRSVSHHGSVSRAAVLTMVVFLDHVSSIQSDNWAIRVDVPHRTIQRRLHQDCVTKRAWSLVVCNKASKSIGSCLQKPNCFDLGGQHNRHHVGVASCFFQLIGDFIAAASHIIVLTLKSANQIRLFCTFSLELVHVGIGKVDRLLQAQSLVSSTKPRSKEEAKEYHRQNGEKTNSALSMFMFMSMFMATRSALR